MAMLKRNNLHEIQVLNLELTDLEAQYRTFFDYKEEVGFGVDYGEGLKPEHVRKSHFSLEIPKNTEAYDMIIKAFQRAVERKIINVVDALENLGVEINSKDLLESLNTPKEIATTE